MAGVEIGSVGLSPSRERLLRHVKGDLVIVHELVEDDREAVYYPFDLIAECGPKNLIASASGMPLRTWFRGRGFGSRTQKTEVAAYWTVTKAG